ncbi:photosynthetic complex putative assembly protein PuhB, partial [Pseudomonas aeruginosa]
LLVLLGYLAARTTVYTITSRRLVMRIGIALPMTLNLPFKVIASAAARINSDGTADIPITLVPPNRLAFLILWPHCRPWTLRRPEP